MAELLDGVSDIDWAGLTHAYGPAAQVPAWLAALRDPARCDSALDDLDMAVYHQGGVVYSAGAAVVPFLLRFALDPVVPCRVALLDLLRDFAALHQQLKEPWRSQAPARACREALLAGFGDLLTLLTDPDPAVRRAVLPVLAELDDRAEDLAGELMARVPGLTDPGLAADCVLTLGTLGAALPDRRAVGAWLAGRTPPAGDAGRLTFLAARRRLGHGGLPGEDLVAAHSGAVPERSLGWLAQEIGVDHGPRITVARMAIGEAARSRQQHSLAEVGTVLRTWRSAAALLVDDLVAVLDGPPVVQEAGLHLLAAAGAAGRPLLEQVAGLLARPGRVGALAAWVLARRGDRRAVPVVERSLPGGPDVFGMSSTHYSDDFYWPTQDPGIADVCLPLAAYAGDLLPAIRRRLRTDPALPTSFQLTQVLGGYGPAAVAALPELTEMLDREHSGPACTVLAGLGPAAAPARPGLARLAASGSRDSGVAAWALFRITGDPGPFLASDDVVRADLCTMSTARGLAEIGPAAAHQGSRVEERLREGPQWWGTWPGVELGHAHYRITGDPALCLEVLGAALDPLRQHRQVAVTRQALRHLGGLGAAAAGFVPLLRNIVTSDERLRGEGGWRGIDQDEEARDAAEQALTAITGDQFADGRSAG